MRLETLVEIVRAHTGCDDRDQQQEDGQESKSSQRLAGWLVVLLACNIGHVHSNELEQEITERNEVDEDDGDHARNGFAAHPPGSGEQKEESDNEGSTGEGEFERLCVLNDDQELHSKGQEEEEIKLEQGDVNLDGVSMQQGEGCDSCPYLVRQVASLESGVGTDALVDGPRELVVQLPGLECERKGSDRHENWQGDQHGLHVFPKLLGNEGILVQRVCSILDLIELDGGIYENTHVVENEPDDLNGVLQAQGVPDEEQLVDVAEHEDGQICGDGARLVADAWGGKVDAALEFAKDISGGWLG